MRPRCRSMPRSVTVPVCGSRMALPFVSVPLSPNSNPLNPGVVVGCPGSGISQTCSGSNAPLVRLKLVEPEPRTSTYHTPGVKYDGTIYAEGEEYGLVPENPSSFGREFLRT